jgi:hypothetical protein
MCADLGHVLINWSGAEQSLDMCVSIVFRQFQESQKGEDGLPKALNRKTTFMRKALRKIPALNEFSEFGVPVMDQVDKLATDRNDMIHGALSSTSAINGQWRFLKFDYGSTIHTVRSVAYSQADYQEAGKEMMALAADVQRLADRLQKFLLLPSQ